MTSATLQLHCLKCGHHWETRRDQEPRVCPKCKRFDWREPRKDGRVLSGTPVAAQGIDEDATPDR